MPRPVRRVPRRVPSRLLAATAGLAAAALTVGGTTLVTAPVASGAPAVAECPAPFPVGELAGEQPVSGLTVSKGTVPEEFTGEVIGVLDDGIGPDLDMIVVRLTSDEIDRVGGIWSGMSGSPVYAEDGRLIGAVAYGLAWGASPVAGVTPYAEMQGHLAKPPAATVSVSGADARMIAASSSVTRAQAAGGFRQLPMPTAAAGIRPNRLEKVRKRMHTVRDARALGAAVSTSGPGAEAIVAGGNLGATLTQGYITLGGVGTVTAVCGSRVVGFGHPMSFSGKATMGLNPATAVFIQEDPLDAPFKVANFAPAVGTITDDRMAAIAGTLGPAPRATVLQSKAAYAGSSRSALTKAYTESVTADATYLQLLSLLDRVHDGFAAGSAEQTWTVRGRRANGTPWSYTRGNRYRDANDLAYLVPEEVASEVWRVGSFPGVTVDSVITDTSSNDDSSQWKITGVQRKVTGGWDKVERRERVRAKPGKTLRLRVQLKSPGARRTVPFNLTIPKKARGGKGIVRISGGQGWYHDFDEEFFFEGPAKGGLNGFLDEIKGKVRNDQVRGNLSLFGMGGPVERELRSDVLTKVVQGHAKVKVRVARR